MSKPSARHVLAAWLCAVVCGAGAAPFDDPLATPAAPTAVAQNTRLMAVSAAGNSLIAVGPAGRVLRSTDQGGTWQQMPVPLSSDLVAVRFATAQQGWAVGHDGVVLHSADGGRTWAKQLDGVAAARLIEADSKRDLPAGQPGADATRAVEVQRFVDEGADKPLFDVLFLSDKEGFVVGAFNLAFRTQDGGQTWTSLYDRMDNPQGFHLYGLADSGKDIYVAGEQGLLRRWKRDTGRFETLNSPYKGTFFGVLAKGATVLAFGMRGNAFLSTDSGSSWKKTDTGTTSSITAGTLLADGRFVLVTQAGTVLASDDGGASFAALKLDRAMPYFGVASASAQSLAFVGPAGVRIESIKQRSKPE